MESQYVSKSSQTARKHIQSVYEFKTLQTNRVFLAATYSLIWQEIDNNLQIPDQLQKIGKGHI